MLHNGDYDTAAITQSFTTAKHIQTYWCWLVILVHTVSETIGIRFCRRETVFHHIAVLYTSTASFHIDIYHIVRHGLIPSNNCSVLTTTIKHLSGMRAPDRSCSSSLFSCTSVCMGQHLTAALHRRANLEAWRHLRCYLAWTLRHTWPSIVGDQVFPVAATCTWNSRPPPPNMSCPYPLCMFSEVASRLSCLGIPSHDFHHNICSACARTVVIFCFRHFNRLLYLTSNSNKQKAERKAKSKVKVTQCIKGIIMIPMI